MYKNIEEKIEAIENYIEALEMYINDCEEFQEKYNTDSLEFNIEKSKARINYYKRVLQTLKVEPKLC